MTTSSDAPRKMPPGTEKPRKVPPRGLRYELISCGLSGHELVGTDAAHIRPEDALFAREIAGLRWHRCLRCDSWLPQPVPEPAAREYPPAREQIKLPLRGRPLRDKYVLRLIALDRALHFLVLGVLAVAIFAFLSHRLQLRHDFFRIIEGLQAGFGGVASSRTGGIVGDVQHLFSFKQSTLYAVGFVFAAYALLEGTEAVGLWLRKRWAEYLTFVATTLLFIPEIYELVVNSVTPLKVLTLLINLAIVAYLILGKRLFGVRGGGRVERAEIERDSSWEALERVLPGPR
ncbi:MAG: DUF2127 domain-containing protein [Solirubrobacterales bacterium]|nr:DUF2127 domain-containing protein [Solirubrobacterales bacterium]